MFDLNEDIAEELAQQPPKPVLDKKGRVLVYPHCAKVPL